jgi:hypothetical protein
VRPRHLIGAPGRPLNFTVRLRRWPRYILRNASGFHWTRRRMITAEKLAVYRSYGGNVDLWRHAGSPKSDIISAEDWAAIGNLLQELAFYKGALAGERYREHIRRRLAQVAADQETERQLLKMM